MIFFWKFLLPFLLIFSYAHMFLHSPDWVHTRFGPYKQEFMDPGCAYARCSGACNQGSCTRWMQRDIWLEYGKIGALQVQMWICNSNLSRFRTFKTARHAGIKRSREVHTSVDTINLSRQRAESLTTIHFIRFWPCCLSCRCSRTGGLVPYSILTIPGFHLVS